ncbi:MAG: HAD family phosphatase [Bryobacteraceae bacterium]
MALVDSYEAFIFDYGGVLVHDQTAADQARLAAIARIPEEVFSGLYWSKRPDYDKGLLSGAEYWQSIARDSGTRLTQSAIEDLTELDNVSWMRFDGAMWDWVDELRNAGKRIALLSNMPRDLGEALRTRTERLNSFDQVTLSYEVGSVKPEPAIYEHCLEGLGTPAGQSLFLDDRIANVHGAELLGIPAIQFTSREEALQRLA